MHSHVRKYQTLLRGDEFTQPLHAHDGAGSLAQLDPEGRTTRLMLSGGRYARLTWADDNICLVKKSNGMAAMWEGPKMTIYQTGYTIGEGDSEKCIIHKVGGTKWNRTAPKGATLNILGHTMTRNIGELNATMRNATWGQRVQQHDHVLDPYTVVAVDGWADIADPSPSGINVGGLRAATSTASTNSHWVAAPPRLRGAGPPRVSELHGDILRRGRLDILREAILEANF